MFAMISSKATSRSRSAAAAVPGSFRRSIDRVPITCPRCTSGTQMNAIGRLSVLAPVLLRNLLSAWISGTTSHLPVCATRPVTPSPMR